MQTRFVHDDTVIWEADSFLPVPQIGTVVNVAEVEYLVERVIPTYAAERSNVLVVEVGAIDPDNPGVY